MNGREDYNNSGAGIYRRRGRPIDLLAGKIAAKVAEVAKLQVRKRPRVVKEPPRLIREREHSRACYRRALPISSMKSRFVLAYLLMTRAAIEAHHIVSDVPELVSLDLSQ